MLAAALSTAFARSLSCSWLGPLKLTGRVVRTINELETGYLVAEKIVTKFVIECQQLGFKWEVARRYSEFHKFNELLTLQWEDLP